MKTLPQTYTMKPRLVSRPPTTTQVNSMLRQQGLPHHVLPSSEHQGLISLSPLTTQQQIVAFELLGASTNLNSNVMNFDIPFDLLMY